MILLSSACDQRTRNGDTIDSVSKNELLTIGSEDQDFSYQLGDPIAVRTDKNNHIYIADRASLTIKKFNESGVFLGEFGRRGRGPGEFLDINTFEWANNETFFVLDRGNMRYTTITTSGDYVSEVPIEFSMEWQFYPDALQFYNDEAIILFNSGTFDATKPLEEKKLLYVYNESLTEQNYSFFKFLDFVDLEFSKFAWVTFLGRPGSITLNDEKDTLYYSPLVYHGRIYSFIRADSGWKFQKAIESDYSELTTEWYTEFSEQEFSKYRAQGVPGLVSLMYGGLEPNIGRVNVFDAGIHNLGDGRLIVFTGKWRDALSKKGDHDPVIDIYAQIISGDDEIIPIGLVTSVPASRLPWKPLINWMDKDRNFYLLQNTDIGYPVVRKFSINLQ